MVYDITDPANSMFANYIIPETTAGISQATTHRRGLCFIPAGESWDGNA